MPVGEEDIESRVGFSHNSLREFMVADALADYLKNGTHFDELSSLIVTDTVADFVFGIAESDAKLLDALPRSYADCVSTKMGEVLFKVIQAFMRKKPSHVQILGSPPVITSVDLSNLDLSGLRLEGARVRDCIALDTDFRKSDLRRAVFRRTILESILLDGAILDGADFREAEIVSIFVFDEYDTRTSAILGGRQARQWLYSSGALVSPSNDLNPLLGKPWYEAAREVTKTLEKRIGGTHQDVPLSKGTNVAYREFATEFVGFLVSSKILKRVRKSSKGPGYVLRLEKEYRAAIHDFSRDGKITEVLEPFFAKFLKGSA